MPRFIAVVAASPSGVIGRDGDMPWHLSSDLKRFKQLTLGAPIVMGRKTYDSIGRPLPGRKNIVLTHSPQAVQGDVHCVSDMASLRSATSDAEKVFLIGGASLYDWLLPECDEILLTRVWTQTSGDTVISLDLSAFRCRHIERVPQTMRDSMPTEFQIWRRSSST